MLEEFLLSNIKDLRPAKMKFEINAKVDGLYT